jgi:hypothetical protein
LENPFYFAISSLKVYFVILLAPLLPIALMQQMIDAEQRLHAQ